MANNQSQNSSRSQSSGGTTGSGSVSGSGSRSQTQGQSQAQQHSQSSTPSQSSSGSTSHGSQTSGSSMSSGRSDAIEQAISKGIRSMLDTVEPQLNRIANQLVDRVMSRGQDIADSGVRHMQDQPWYMAGGALALVAVGVGLLFAFENQPSRPDFSNVQ